MDCPAGAGGTMSCSSALPTASATCKAGEPTEATANKYWAITDEFRAPLVAGRPATGGHDEDGLRFDGLVWGFSDPVAFVGRVVVPMLAFSQASAS